MADRPRISKRLSPLLGPLLNALVPPRIEQRLNQRFGEGWAERFTNAVAEIERRVPDEWETWLRHPRTLTSWIESHSPWLSRRFLAAASNWVEPFTVGMGLRIERLGEDRIEVTMPGSWRNQGEGGVVHSGALSALGEFAVRLFWEYHLDLRISQLESRRVQVRMIARPQGDMKAVFRLPVTDREAILHRLRAEQSCTVETETLIYDVDGKRVAEVDVEWLLSRQLVLASPPPPEGSDPAEA